MGSSSEEKDPVIPTSLIELSVIPTTFEGKIRSYLPLKEQDFPEKWYLGSANSRNLGHTYHLLANFILNNSNFRSYLPLISGHTYQMFRSYLPPKFYLSTAYSALNYT